MLSTPVTSIWKTPWVRKLRRRVRRPLQITAAPVLASYIKLAINTSTIVSDPRDWLARVQELHPSIVALWHGQFLLLPGIYPPVIPGRAMVARHDDAEALARVLRRFGLGLIRGAGLGAPMKYDDELFLILLAVFVLIGLAMLLAVLY